MLEEDKFKNSYQWVFHFVPHYGREWVASNYELHKREIIENPVSPETFSRYIRKAIELVKIKDQKNGDDFPRTDWEENRNKKTYSFVSSHEIRTLEDAIDYAKIDTVTWEPIKLRVNSWGSPTNPNYQVRVECKKREQESNESILEEFKKDAENYAPSYPTFERKKTNNHNLLEISIPDLHLGQLSWADETKDKHYDIKIAERMFLETIDYFINAVQDIDIDKILFPIGNDFFNVDSALKTTASGTVQDEDCRWPKSFTIGRQIAVAAIDMLLTIADIDVIIVPGNHDMERAYYLGEVLSAWYRSTDQVRVDNRPLRRKYVHYGNNLIGFDHGTKSKGARKLDKLPLIMADEASEAWSKTKYREIHTAHLHSQSSLEVRGVRVITLPSIVPLSAWAYAEGYAHMKEAQAMIWNKEHGRTTTIHYKPPYEEIE